MGAVASGSNKMEKILIDNVEYDKNNLLIGYNLINRFVELRTNIGRDCLITLYIDDKHILIGSCELAKKSEIMEFANYIEAEGNPLDLKNIKPTYWG